MRPVRALNQFANSIDSAATPSDGNKGNTMTKPKALILGCCTLWPILYIFLFMGTIFTQFMMMDFGGKHAAGEMPLLFKIIFPLHFLTMIWIFVLVAIYIIHIFKTEAVPQDKKALWAVVIFCGNMIAMPVYWYLYIWKKPRESGTTANTPQGPIS